MVHAHLNKKIHLTDIECLLCTSHCSGCQGHSSEPNRKSFYLHGAYTIVAKETDNKQTSKYVMSGGDRY